MADALMSEYGWSLAYVLHGIPLAQAFMFMGLIRAKNDPEHRGPSYGEMEMIGQLNREAKP